MSVDFFAAPKSLESHKAQAGLGECFFVSFISDKINYMGGILPKREGG